MAGRGDTYLSLAFGRTFPPQKGFLVSFYDDYSTCRLYSKKAKRSLNVTLRLYYSTLSLVFVLVVNVVPIYFTINNYLCFVHCIHSPHNPPPPTTQP